MKQAPNRLSLQLKKNTRNLLLAASLCLGTAAVSAQTFDPAIVPDDVFPIPTNTVTPPATPPPGPPAPSVTFYGNRSGGSCYSSTFKMYGTKVNASVWAINNISTIGYQNAVAYRITDAATGALKYRGTQYIGGDITELQVGLYNDPGVQGGSYMVIAYWQPLAPSPTVYPGEIKLQIYKFTSGTGIPVWQNTLTLGTTTSAPGVTFYTASNHISLDCHDMSSFTVAWDDPGSGINMIGFDINAIPLFPHLSSVFTIPGTSGSSKLPDVAMNHNTTTNDVNVHVAFAETSGPGPTISKYTVDFASLIAGTPTYTLDDVLPLGITPLGSNWDDFQLKIDAPDHYSAAPSDWAYTYYNHDANKINVRVSNSATTPMINSYVVNDGSMFPPMGDLTEMGNTGNAFPTITYTPSSNELYVGWYTNYDPLTMNRPLYYYNPGGTTKTYVSAVIDIWGNMLTTNYQEVSMNYYGNRVGESSYGGGYVYLGGYPQICFSKNNDAPKLLTVFSSQQNSIIWPYPATTSPYLPGYYAEYSGAPSTPGFNVTAGLNYAGFTGGPYPFQPSAPSLFIANKETDWFPSTIAPPLFRLAAAEAKTISVGPNPFNGQQVFQLNGGDAKLSYTTRLNSMDGKQIAQYSGTIAQINTALKGLQTGALASGTYLLQVSDAKNKPQQFKLTKQ